MEKPPYQKRMSPSSRTMRRNNRKDMDADDLPIFVSGNMKPICTEDMSSRPSPSFHPQNSRDEVPMARVSIPVHETATSSLCETGDDAPQRTLLTAEVLYQHDLQQAGCLESCDGQDQYVEQPLASHAVRKNSSIDLSSQNLEIEDWHNIQEEDLVRDGVQDLKLGDIDLVGIGAQFLSTHTKK